MSPKNEPTKTTKGAPTRAKKAAGFTADERAAMKERARELKAESSGRASRAEGEREVLAKIAAMSEPDRAMAKKIHALISKAAPDLVPRTYYGMPAYAKDGKVLCFFQSAGKFKARYATLGFSDQARLDDGSMWPTAFALKRLTTKDEARIAALVTTALG